MDKTALNARLFTTRLKRDFYHQKLLTREDQMCEKVLVANGKNEQLDFAAC